MNKPVVWTIGGSDSGGGAGIQADLATFRALGVYGASVVTTVTAQNTQTLLAAEPVSPGLLSAQLAALQADLPPTAIKVGALGSRGAAERVLEFLQESDAFVVWDPVLRASVGGALGERLPLSLHRALLRRADVVTPNAQEAELWLGTPTHDLQTAARGIAERGARYVLLKGGHTSRPALDYWHAPAAGFWLEGDELPADVGHGGGCSLASAMAAAHALGHDTFELPVIAKAYVTQGRRRGDRVGGGRAPLAHLGWPHEQADFPRVHDVWPPPTPVLPRLDRPLGLYAVVDSAAWVERLTALEVPTIQLRIKQAARDQLEHEVARSVAAVVGSRSRLFVNDHWALAIAAGAYGVHLGQEDLAGADLSAIASAGLRLGISCHSEYEIARACALQPSYLALGPIYPTTTKEMAFAPQGTKRLRGWVRRLGPWYPLTAIGGIDLARVPAVLETGITSIAVVRAITEAANCSDAVAKLRDALRGR